MRCVNESPVFVTDEHLELPQLFHLSIDSIVPSVCLLSSQKVLEPSFTSTALNILPCLSCFQLKNIVSEIVSLRVVTLEPISISQGWPARHLSSCLSCLEQLCPCVFVSVSVSNCHSVTFSRVLRRENIMQRTKFALIR